MNVIHHFIIFFFFLESSTLKKKMKEKEETGERKTITTQNPLNILKFPNEKQRNG